jgi:hypothetical protein
MPLVADAQQAANGNGHHAPNKANERPARDRGHLRLIK